MLNVGCKQCHEFNKQPPGYMAAYFLLSESWLHSDIQQSHLRWKGLRMTQKMGMGRIVFAASSLRFRGWGESKPSKKNKTPALKMLSSTCD